MATTLTSLRMLAALGCVAALPEALLGQGSAGGPRVVPVYLVPGDMPVQYARIGPVVSALDSVQGWYRRVLRGATFRHDPLVVQRSSHTFAEFAADSFQAWWPLLQAEFKEYGQDWEDDDTKMLWIANGAGAWAGADSENGGIDSIAEAGRVPDGDHGGLAVIGDSSLGGVLARVCPDSGRTGTAWWCSWKTFEGTIAHELGHTWGLPHPDAFSPGFRCADSTAWTNMQCHWGFPFDSLLPYEQKHLRSLRYFAGAFAVPPERLMATRVRGTLRAVSWSPGEDNLLWLTGRGNGTGYLWGFVLQGAARSSAGVSRRLFQAEIGLLHRTDSATVRIRLGRALAYERVLGPGDPPLPVALVWPPGLPLTIESAGKVGIAVPRVSPEWSGLR